MGKGGRHLYWDLERFAKAGKPEIVKKTNAAETAEREACKEMMDAVLAAATDEELEQKEAEEAVLAAFEKYKATVAGLIEELSKAERLNNELPKASSV